MFGLHYGQKEPIIDEAPEKDGDVDHHDNQFVMW
jgi:hypothetical protein